MLQRVMQAIFRSDFSARIDAVHAELRADVARKCAEGKAWDGLRENVALLGLKTDAGSRPKLVFGARR